MQWLSHTKSYILPQKVVHQGMYIILTFALISVLLTPSELNELCSAVFLYFLFLTLPDESHGYFDSLSLKPLPESVYLVDFKTSFVRNRLCYMDTMMQATDGRYNYTVTKT
jgi:hypothetical protein